MIVLLDESTEETEAALRRDHELRLALFAAALTAMPWIVRRKR